MSVEWGRLYEILTWSSKHSWVSSTHMA